MLSRSKVKVLGTIVNRLLKANFSSSRACGRIQNLHCNNHNCTVLGSNSNWNDALKIDKHKEVNTFWLRENCRCNECYNLETQQRNVLFHRLNPNSFEVERLKEAGEGETIEVLWGDRHVSYYDKEWLRSKLINESLHLQDKKMFLWDANTIFPFVEERKIKFENLMHDNASLKLACEKLFEFGFLQIEDVPKNMDDTIRMAKQISHIKETFFGKTWEVNTENHESLKEANFKDTAYGNAEISPHTDGNYFSESPSLMVFHHLKQADDGGEMILVDGFQAAVKLKTIEPQAFEILSNQLIDFNFKDDTRYLHQTCPTLELDKVTGDLRRIRYNHYDRSANIINSNVPASAFYEALSMFSHIIEDPSNQLEFKPEPGTAIFVDNWRVMHGRRAFKGRRIFIGCYLERDKWISNLLML